MPRTWVKVRLQAETEVEIEVEHKEDEDPCDLTSEDETEALKKADPWPEWKVAGVVKA